MDWNGANKALRSVLDFPANTYATEHPQKVESARKSYPHSVSHVPGTGGLTCVPYALELADVPVYQAIGRDFGGEVFAGREFVEWLLEGRLKELVAPIPGCLAFYFEGWTWRHVGITGVGERVVSKWGTFPVYEHDFWEVPLTYGDRIRFFEQLSSARAIELFLEFARASVEIPREVDEIIKEVERAAK